MILEGKLTPKQLVETENWDKIGSGLSNQHDQTNDQKPQQPQKPNKIHPKSQLRK